MDTIDNYKQSIEHEIQKVLKLNNTQVFLGPDKNFETITNIVPDFVSWIDTEIITKQGSYKFKNTFDMHSDLYFGRIKIDLDYDKETVRSMYFALSNIKSKLLKIKEAEYICTLLSELGTCDGAKRKVSAIGKYFINNTNLSNNAETKFKNKYKVTWNLGSFVDFKESYILSYQESRNNYQEEKAQKAQSRRHSSDAIKNSYSGNVEELIEWIRNNIEYVSVKVPCITLEDYNEYITTNKKGIQKSIAEIKYNVIESTEELINEARELGLVEDGFELKQGQGLYSAWTIKLKSSAQNTMPKEVSDWYYDKKKPSNLDDYIISEVFRTKQNTITGNPVVKDLVFNYGFKLTKN